MFELFNELVIILVFRKYPKHTNYRKTWNTNRLHEQIMTYKKWGPPNLPYSGMKINFLNSTRQPWSQSHSCRIVLWVIDRHDWIRNDTNVINKPNTIAWTNWPTFLSTKKSYEKLNKYWVKVVSFKFMWGYINFFASCSPRVDLYSF
jgi:hypothetical protein